MYVNLCQQGACHFCQKCVAYGVANFLDPQFFERWAIREEALAECCTTDETFFAYYDEDELYTLNLPTTPNGYPDTERQRMEKIFCSKICINSPYVCEVNDVNIVGPEAVPVKDGGYVIDNCLGWCKRLKLGCVRALREGVLPAEGPWLCSERKLGTVLSLVGPWTNNYTHWFQDYLTRLEGLEYYREKTGVDPDILIPRKANEWMRDALRAVGYGPEQWIEWNGGRASVDRLIVSSVRRERERASKRRRLVYSPTGVQWISDHIKSNIEPEKTVPHSNRVYLSRANMSKRRVRNEDEVMDLLADWGFERYRPDELSFAEQVTLFSNAEVIVSPHGSGLMNQIFAEDAVIIELMGKKQTITTPATEYFYAELLGHSYACVPGDAVGANLRTDVSGLDAVLRKLLDKE